MAITEEPSDPFLDIDEVIKRLTSSSGPVPDRFIDLDTGEMITPANFGDWLKRHGQN